MKPAPSTSRTLTPWLLAGPGALFFSGMILLPLALTVILSFHAYDHATGIKDTYTLAHYIAVVTDEYYLGIFWRTLRIAALTTLICAIIGAPEAYVLARMHNPWRSIFLLVIIGPLLVSVVVRAFGWSMLLGSQGLVNQALQLLGLPSARLLYTETAIVIALVHVMLPFMVIPIWTALQKLDPMVEAAAWSLGASRFAALRRVVLPQVSLGMLSGCLIVFGLSASAFAIPGLLGGRRLKMAATLVYDEYLHELNWPLGAAIAIIVLIANLLIMLAYNRMVETKGAADARVNTMQKNGPLALIFHSLVVAFVLAPLVIICLVAFTPENTLSLPTAGVSLRWFKAVFAHPDFVASFWNSIWLATLSATLSVALAVPAGLAISRLDFAGRDALNALFLSPLIIPHLVLGVAFLRLFALVGATGSFAWLVATHIVIVTPYVLRLVLAALSGLDRSAEQAAMTLGASPWTTFRRVTAPMILPGITGGWLLAFINSFDELTMSIFVTAPSTVTLPVRMYMYATESIDPMMAAVSALMIALTAVAMLVLDLAFGLDKILVGQR